MNCNLIIAGVGGQGVILAGNIIGDAAIASGYDVKKTDTIGMAQRGGSVISHMRIAPKIYPR
jgi:indolepyruvate ferredoxin oxidoreductase beta subunit